MSELIKQAREVIPSKKNASDTAAQIAEAVVNGNISGTQAKVFASYLKELAKQIDSNAEILESAIQEKEESYKGAEIRIGEAGTRYDFTNTPIYAELKEEMKPIIERLNEVENLAKVINRPCTWINPIDGEEHVVQPAIKRSKTTLFIKLPKE